MAHGIGLFETMLVVRGRALDVEPHAARMDASAAALGLPRIDARTFAQEVAGAAAQASDLDEAALRCVWAAVRPDLGDPASWLLQASIGPVPETTLRRRSLGRLATLTPHFTRALPQHKLTSYAVCVFGLRDALARGADEGLFVAPDGSALEGTATNVFALRGSTLVTAPIAAGILPGIVRAQVLELAASIGIAVEWRCPTPHELRKGSFLTGSLTGVVPIRALDGAACDPPGEAFAEIMRRVKSEE